LRDQREVLTNRWIKSELRDTDIGHCDALTYEQQADHIPVILDQICYFLESEHLKDVEAAIERDAREHGHWRWKQGYRLDELIRELDLFRRVLTAAIATFAEVNHDFTRSHESHARDLVDDAVNFVMLTSVRQLVGEQKRKVDEYAGMLEEANRGLAFLTRETARKKVHAIPFHRRSKCLRLLPANAMSNDRAYGLASKTRSVVFR